MTTCVAVRCLHGPRAHGVTRGTTARGTPRDLCQHRECTADSFLLDSRNRGGVRIGPFGSGRRSIVTAPRFVLFDLGVRHVLADLPANQTLLTLDAEHIFEQWVMTELYYRCLHLGRGYRLSTWRTRTGAEVDVIVETPDALLPIEIEWTDRPQSSDARHVERFISLHNDRCQQGYVVCRTPHRQQLTTRVRALPWNEF